MTEFDNNEIEIIDNSQQINTSTTNNISYDNKPKQNIRKSLSTVKFEFNFSHSKKNKGAFSFLKEDFDCDLSAFLCGDNNKTISPNVKENCIYFLNHTHTSGAIRLENNKNNKKRTNTIERITIDLTNLPPTATNIYCVINVYDGKKRKHNFGTAQDLTLSVTDVVNSNELYSKNLSQSYSNYNAIVIGKFYKVGEIWDYKQIGYSMNNINRIDNILKDYV